MRDFLRKVGAADTDVADRKAQRFGRVAQLCIDLLHHLRTFVRQCRIEVAQTVDPAKRRVETRAKTGFRSFPVAGYRLAEPARIADLVDHERVDLVEGTAADLDADVVEIEAERPVLDILDAIGIHEPEGQLEVEARLGLDVLDLTEADDDRLLPLVHHEDGGVDEEEDDRETDQDSWETIGVHRLPPCWLPRISSLRGR